MSQIDWYEEGDNFIITVEDFEDDLEDRYGKDAWDQLHWILNESSQMTGGMRGNSNYEIMTYADILRVVDHRLFVDRHYLYRRRSNLPDRCTEVAFEDVRVKHNFNLLNVFGERYKMDWHFLCDFEYDERGNVIGVYNIWAWSKFTDPIYELQKGRNIVFKRVEVPPRWRMVEVEVVYSIDNVGPLREVLRKRTGRKVESFLSRRLWDEYPYRGYRDFIVEEENILGEMSEVKKRAYRQYNVLTIHQEVRLD